MTSKRGGDTEQSSSLPISALLALATAGFITIVTEALPAGLLPQISASLMISESVAGQLITIYAMGSIVAAIPLTSATRGLRRRPLLLTAIAGFAIANTITAISGNYVLTMAARFIAGMSAGLLWALIAGFAARMAPEHLQGRAIAIAMVGIPLALSFGVPLGTFMGTNFGWRLSFGVMSVATLVLIVWVLVKVPDFLGDKSTGRPSIGSVFALPGIRPILFVTLTFVLAHNILYTYIAPFLRETQTQLGGRSDIMLMIFGLMSLLSLWGTGLLIDRWLRELTLASVALFLLSMLALWTWPNHSMAIYFIVGAWGLAFGGIATLVQTALAITAGPSVDVAQSMLVTIWNIAIAGGGIVGGLLLNGMGVGSFPPVLFGLLLASLVVAWVTRARSLPSIELNTSSSTP